MEEQLFDNISILFCATNTDIKKGKMMSSKAITFRGKVFAFFSRKKKMVFKLGEDFDTQKLDIEIDVFSPFKSRSPMRAWFEVPYSENYQWESLAQLALDNIKKEI